MTVDDDGSSWASYEVVATEDLATSRIKAKSEMSAERSTNSMLHIHLRISRKLTSPIPPHPLLPSHLHRQRRTRNRNPRTSPRQRRTLSGVKKASGVDVGTNLKGVGGMSGPEVVERSASLAAWNAEGELSSVEEILVKRLSLQVYGTFASTKMSPTPMY